MLHLTGKGSILDAIGGALNTGANAVVAGTKDLGDLGSLGMANLTGNQQAANNARNAISSNDSNLSGGNFAQNLGGLSQDLGLTQATKSAIGLGIGAGLDLSGNGSSPTILGNSPLGGLENWSSNNNKTNITSPRAVAGNATMTGVNLLTLGKGKALEKGVEKLVPGITEEAGRLVGGTIPKAVAHVTGGVTTAGAYGAGQGASNAISTAQTPKQAVQDVVQPAIKNAELGAGLGLLGSTPSLVKAGASTVAEHTTSLGQAGGGAIEDSSIRKALQGGNTLPNPTTTEEDVAKIQQLGQEPHPGLTTESTPTEPSPDELQQMTDNFHADVQNPEIDWTKVSGAGKAVQQAVADKANSLQQMETGLKGGQMQATTDGGFVRTSEHSPFYRQVFEETGRAPTKAAWKAEAERQLQAGTDEESQNYKNLQRHAVAEQNINDLQKADRASGYNVAKHQLPTGAPAKKFVQDLWDKTYSPEYQARNQIGQLLGDAKKPAANTYRGQLATYTDLVKKAQAEYNALKKSGASEADLRAKSVEVGDLTGTLRHLQGKQHEYSLAYREAATNLDNKYPDINLAAKKGVRATVNQPFETAKPAEIDENGNVVPKKVKVMVAKTDEPYSLAEALGHELKSEPYTGPNFNEGAFDPKEIAKLTAAQALKEAEAAKENPIPMNIEGDRAMLEAMQRGASEAEATKAYQEATGADEATARAAHGHLEDNPHVNRVGNPTNNPKYGTGVKYAMGKAEDADRLNVIEKGKIKVGLGKDRVNEGLLNKAVLDATAPERLDKIKTDLAKSDFTQLSPEDQALADKMRGHSDESILREAQDPETMARYLKQSRDIGDTRHEDIRNADPRNEGLLYRQNRGTTFSLKDEKGNPVRAGSYEDDEKPWEKARHFNTYEQVEEASGLKRSSANFHEDLENEGKTVGRYITEHRLVNNLREAFGSDAAVHADEKMATGGLHQLKEYKNVYVRPDLAKRLNARKFYEYDEGKRGAVLKKYDALNNAIKTAKLSFGGFHNINVGLSEAALHPTGIPDVVHAWASDPFYRDKLHEWIDNGTMEKALHGGVTLDAGSEFSENTGLVNKLPGIKQLHDALFQRQIPFSKMSDFEKYTKGMTLQDNYKDIRGVARGVNNIYGGINRLVDGISSSNAKMLGRAVLAEDYNEGQLRILMTAISKGGKEGEIARRMIGGKLSILAAPGTLQAIATGQIGKKPEDWAKFIAKQVVDPGVATPWKTAGGTPKRVSLIATPVNKIYRAIAPAFNLNNPDKASGLKHELIGNESALVSVIQQEVNNSDYYGNKLHGGNISSLQAAANLLNAGAPIPAQPAARALEGTRYGKNAVVKTLAGGQSAISPLEAATDISGVGRISADPNAPVMQVMNNRQLVREGLSSDDQGVLDKIHPSWNQDLTKQQQADIYNNSHYEENKWTSLLDNQSVFNVLKKQNDFAVAHGQPADPLFKLSSQDQKTVMTYEQLKSSDPDANDTAAVIYADNKDLISQYEKDAQNFGKQNQALYQQSGGLKGDQGPQITPGGVPFPNITQAQEDLANQYAGITDAKTKAQFIGDHPELAQMYTALFNYENGKRAALGEPLLKDYPQAAPELQSWITQYVNADKAGRAGLRTASPDKFNAMQNYMAQVDEYNLAKTAGQAKFQGHDFSQQNLKQIYNLGNYDIAPTVNADGTTAYSVNPQAAYAAGSGKGGKSSGKSSGYAKAASQLRGVKMSSRLIKADMQRNRIRLSGRSKPLRGFGLKGQPHQPKYVTLKTPKTGKLRIKSTSVA